MEEVERRATSEEEDDDEGDYEQRRPTTRRRRPASSHPFLPPFPLALLLLVAAARPARISIHFAATVPAPSAVVGGRVDGGGPGSRGEQVRLFIARGRGRTGRWASPLMRRHQSEVWVSTSKRGGGAGELETGRALAVRCCC